jgi:putative nucleotidyltransferase with HDIG domain
MLSRDDLFARLKTVDNLPTISQVLSELMSRLGTPDHDASDLADIIVRDPSLATRFLRLANSAYYGLPCQVRDVTHALVMLGEQEVYRMVATVSVFSALGAGGSMTRHRERFWVHSVSCAVIANMLDKVLGLRLGGVAYTAGLLHDVGKVVLDQVFPREFAACLQLAESRGCPSREVELELLGADHCEVGAWLAERWSLPGEIVETIRHHHCFPEVANHRELVGVVAFADSLSHQEVDPELTRERLFWSEDSVSWKEMQALSGRELDPLTLLERAGQAGDEIKEMLAVLGR